MSSDENIALARQAVDAFQRRDVATLMGFLDPEIECHVSRELMNTGTWHGHAGFGAMVSAWEEPWERITYEPTDFETPDDDHVLVHLHQEATGVHSGVPVELDVVYMMELREERGVRLHIYPDRDAALAAVTRDASE
jgi:ketosteroid isomerase-like protein